TMESPWMKTFLVLDPAEYLKRVKAPVLALNGLLDTQVVADQNLPPIRAAVGASGAPLTVREYPGMNHLFQKAATGGVQEYAAIETTIEPEVLRDIATWIRQVTGVKTPWTPPGPVATPAPASPAPR
ncbi:MAG: alpha/beta hydrolase, partial [Phycisphaerae bacterium]|nr:alpha/beta hydrolase [Phycisphaerae bacterium]